MWQPSGARDEGVGQLDGATRFWTDAELADKLADWCEKCAVVAQNTGRGEGLNAVELRYEIIAAIRALKI